MNEPLEFSDEQLTAYLDGEADSELRRSIDDARTKDANLEQRLQRLGLDADTVKAAFDKLLGNAPAPPQVLTDVTDDVRSPGGLAALRLAACAIGFLLVGSLIGWQMSSARHDNWQSAAAIYHKLYVTQTLAHVNAMDSKRSDELRRVSAALGRPIALKGLTGANNLEYKRAQILGYRGRPLIQLAFLTADGVPVALCIMGAPSSDAKEIRADQFAGLNAASWIRDGYEFLILGNTDPARLVKFAHYFETQL